MEVFTLGTVSLIIFVSLIVQKKREAAHISFAVLCLVLFFCCTGVFLYEVFQSYAWKLLRDLGFLTIPPCTVHFAQSLLGRESRLSRRDVVSTSLFSMALALLALFTPLKNWKHYDTFLAVYVAAVLFICYAALIRYTKRRPQGVERRRMVYLSVASATVAMLSSLDVLRFFDISYPPLSYIFVAAFLYFVMILITHPRLPELHEFMARALIVFIVTLFATFTFLVVAGLFGKGDVPPFTHVLLASFIIVIAIEPFKLVLQWLFGYIYPEGKDVFTSLYSFDQKLEKEKSLLLEEMAPVFAHEIRNPLGSIKGAAQYLRSESQKAENQRLLDVIVEEVDRLDSVVSQFLNYAKPYALNLKVQDVNPIVEKAIALIAASDRFKNITIEKELRSDLPPVPVDAEQLVQVILNIALNASEAMPDGGTLVFRTSKINSSEGEAVGITLRDTGKGIKKEDLKNIFKPFYTTKERGVGLGLAICQKIIKSHGGNIRVKSIPNQGSIFYIRLGTQQ